MNETLSEAMINIVRGCTRPVLTFWGIVSWTMMYVNGVESATYTWLVWGMVLWYFGERGALKLKGKIK